jgi:transposase
MMRTDNGNIEHGDTMNDLGAILDSVTKLLPRKQQKILFKEMGNTIYPQSSPAGATLMGMYILEYLNFPQYIDELLGETNTSLASLRRHYHTKEVSEKPMKPSTGIVLSLLVADMIARPRNITPAYKFEEMAEKWRTGHLLGIEPSMLNDDRIGAAMSLIGAKNDTMEEVLFKLIMAAAQKASIPLNGFILDTTVLELDGRFKAAEKVMPGRGKNSFAQLITSLVIASGSRIPVGFGVHAGNTSDASTLPHVYETVNRIADPGAVELLIDRAFPTPSNILFLKEREAERMVQWVSPLKMGLSGKKVEQKIDEAYREEKWQPITYRSSKEKKANIAYPLRSFETTWTLEEKIKPPLEPGQKRRPKGSIKTIQMEVRCVFYRHDLQAARDRENREHSLKQLEYELELYKTKLNKRAYREQTYCESKLKELLNKYASVKPFLAYDLAQAANGSIALSYSRQETALENEVKYDGIFALLTNYPQKKVNANRLISKYRSRDEVEVNIKELRGLLDLERILYQLPERIEAFIFLKVMALFVLTFMRTYANQAGFKVTEKTIQEGMGDMLLVENTILPLGVKSYGVSRDTELNQFFRKIFSLPAPIELIRVLNEAELARIDERVLNWQQAWMQEHQAPSEACQDDC